MVSTRPNQRDCVEDAAVLTTGSVGTVPSNRRDHRYRPTGEDCIYGIPNGRPLFRNSVEADRISRYLPRCWTFVRSVRPCRSGGTVFSDGASLMQMSKLIAVEA